MAIEMKDRLLIGGPGAGHYQSMPADLEIFHYPVRQDSGQALADVRAIRDGEQPEMQVRFISQRYYRERLRAPGIEIIVYRWQGITVAEMLTELVASYQTAKQKESLGVSPVRDKLRP